MKNYFKLFWRCFKAIIIIMMLPYQYFDDEENIEKLETIIFGKGR